MSEPSDRIKVDIFGSTYSLRGGADPASVRKLAAEVDSRMRQLAASAPGADPLKVAVLTALRLADEMRELGEGLETRESDLGTRIDGLVQRLDRAMTEDPHDPEGAAEG